MGDQEDFEIAFFEKLIAKDPCFIQALIPLAEAYTHKGFHEKALQIDLRIVGLRKDDPIVYYNLACSSALVEKKEEAFRALERAIQLGYDDFEHMKKDPDLKILQGDPRFKSLMQMKPKTRESA